MDRMEWIGWNGNGIDRNGMGMGMEWEWNGNGMDRDGITRQQQGMEWEWNSRQQHGIAGNSME